MSIVRRLEYRVALAAIASLLPLLVVLLWLVFTTPLSAAARWTVAAVTAASLVILVAVVKTKIEYPLRTIANIISALREEDYSIRPRVTARADATGELARELDLLTRTLRDRRFGEVEAAALVRTVLEQIDSAIFAFDERGRLRLVNRAGERLLARRAEELRDRTAADLGLQSFVTGVEAGAAEVVLPGGQGRFGIRRTTFRESGVPHVLLVMSDLSRTLRAEERQAWQRLLRVLSHELNNSLTPIRSIAASLSTILAREPLPDAWRDDAQQGLDVIGDRAAALTRFLQAYSNVARLPQPAIQPMDVGDTVRHVAGLESRLAVAVENGPQVSIAADRDQIQQLLINLVRNGADAALETGGGVTVTWQVSIEAVEISVIDEGAGISGTANLFVPFFTTKPGGTGIGLTLARQIAEAHNGTLTLTPRAAPEQGTVARLRLPR